MCYTDCFNTPDRIPQELSTEEVFRILSQIEEAGVVELTLTGGEVFSRPDFMRIYERAHRSGILLTVFTNGTMITEVVADRWAVLRPHSVEISLHGVSAPVFDGVTQIPGSLERCLHGIRLLMARQIPLVLKTVGLTLNQAEILAVKRYAESLGDGVTWKFGQYLRDDLEQSGSPYQFQIPEQELQDLEQRDPELWKAKCEEITRSESTNQACGSGRCTFHIDAYGQLQRCSNNRRASYDLRSGSFRHGFYEALPTFPCPRRPT
jgi:MoaA/NifB/PqqE/SkfB family radical SAM enzyme